MRIDTTASPGETKYPSSPGQLELGRLLVEELQAIGNRDARQDEHGVVLATVPGTVARPAAGDRLCSHLDTSPETTGKGVRPQVIAQLCRRRHRACRATEPSDPRRRQPGAGTAARADAHHHRRHDAAGRRRQGRRGRHHGDRRLAGGASRNPARPDANLLHLRRGDRPRRRSSRPRRRSARRSATRSTATPADEIDVETFSADLAVVTVQGVNIHPSIAKGRMTNAVRAAAAFPRPVAARPALARNDRRPRGLPAPLRDCRRRGRGEDPASCCAISTPRAWRPGRPPPPRSPPT